MTRLRALLSMPMAHPKFPNLQPFEVYLSLRRSDVYALIMLLHKLRNVCKTTHPALGGAGAGS